MEVNIMKKKIGTLPTRQMNDVAVTEADAECLTRLLQAQRNLSVMPRDFPALQKKLEDAELLDSRQIPPDVVTMNSKVHLRNLESGEQVIQTLAFPHGANPSQGRVSILTSLGTAMLGRRVGDFMEFDVPAGVKRFQIEHLLYQPEAANDDDR